MTLRETTTPPTRPRLPTAAEADDMCGRAVLEALRELREERKSTVVRRPTTKSPPAKLTEKRLRDAIRLGVEMAEADALLMLTRKARQVRAAELERRRPHLIVDNTTLH
jgi:hypothetical protein